MTEMTEDRLQRTDDRRQKKISKRKPKMTKPLTNQQTNLPSSQFVFYFLQLRLEGFILEFEGVD